MAFILTTHVHCENCKTPLEEISSISRQNCHHISHIFFLKAQGMHRSKRPNLRESQMKQASGLTLSVIYNELFHDGSGALRKGVPRGKGG